MSNDLHDLALILDSRVPILAIESYEEPRVLEMLTGLAVHRTLPLFTWFFACSPFQITFATALAILIVFTQAGGTNARPLTSQATKIVFP